MRLMEHALTGLLAPRTPPAQGLRQVRLLPNPLDRGWPSVAGKHGSRPVQLRREEEGLLEILRHVERNVDSNLSECQMRATRSCSVGMASSNGVFNVGRDQLEGHWMARLNEAYVEVEEDMEKVEMETGQ